MGTQCWQLTTFFADVMLKLFLATGRQVTPNRPSTHNCWDKAEYERLIYNLIQAVPPQAGFLQRVPGSLQRRFLWPWRDHRQRAKNRNRRLFRIGSAVISMSMAGILAFTPRGSGWILPGHRRDRRPERIRHASNRAPWQCQREHRWGRRQRSCRRGL